MEGLKHWIKAPLKHSFLFKALPYLCPIPKLLSFAFKCWRWLYSEYIWSNTKNTVFMFFETLFLMFLRKYIKICMPHSWNLVYVYSFQILWKSIFCWERLGQGWEIIWNKVERLLELFDDVARLNSPMIIEVLLVPRNVEVSLLDIFVYHVTNLYHLGGHWSENGKYFYFFEMCRNHVNHLADWFVSQGVGLRFFCKSQKLVEHCNTLLVAPEKLVPPCGFGRYH